MAEYTKAYGARRAVKKKAKEKEDLVALAELRKQKLYVDTKLTTLKPIVLQGIERGITHFNTLIGKELILAGWNKAGFTSAYTRNRYKEAKAFVRSQNEIALDEVELDCDEAIVEEEKEIQIEVDEDGIEIVVEVVEVEQIILSESESESESENRSEASESESESESRSEAGSENESGNETEGENEAEGESESENESDNMSVEDERERKAREKMIERNSRFTEILTMMLEAITPSIQKNISPWKRQINNCLDDRTIASSKIQRKWKVELRPIKTRSILLRFLQEKLEYFAALQQHIYQRISSCTGQLSW